VKGMVKRCFDLKGSLHGRYTKLTEEEMSKGSGMKTLKDKNFIDMNSKASVLDIPWEDK